MRQLAEFYDGIGESPYISIHTPIPIPITILSASIKHIEQHKIIELTVLHPNGYPYTMRVEHAPRLLKAVRRMLEEDVFPVEAVLVRTCTGWHLG